jgi:hypothetical protein
MIKRKTEIIVRPTINELVDEFCSLDSNDQAEFFNKMGEITLQWDGGFAYQLYKIVTSPKLNKKGKYIVDLIAEYSREIQI